jgi:hypothetical protein
VFSVQKAEAQCLLAILSFRRRRNLHQLFHKVKAILYGVTYGDSSFVGMTNLALIEVKNGNDISYGQSHFDCPNDTKKVIYLPSAPIVVEILLCRGSAQKIETDSGTIFPKKPNLSASN